MADPHDTEPTRVRVRETSEAVFAALARGRAIVAALLEARARSELARAGTEAAAGEKPAQEPEALIAELGCTVRELSSLGVSLAARPRPQLQELHVPDEEECETMAELYELISTEDLDQRLDQDPEQAGLFGALKAFRTAYEKALLLHRVQEATEAFEKDLQALRSLYTERVLAGVLGSGGSPIES